MRLAPILTVLPIALGLAGDALAQADPSLRTTCGALRAGLAGLPPAGEEDVVVQVRGPVVSARAGDGVATVVLCRPPDPQVVCVTYTIEGREPGRDATVTGAYSLRGPDRVVLDPCLHFPAEGQP